MIDKEFNTLLKRQALLTIALNEAEQQCSDRLPTAGKGRAEYEQWRAWNLILKAVSRGIQTIADQTGQSPELLGLYLSEIQRTDHQFLPTAEQTVHDFYQDCLHRQDILMASAFDAARQAVKALAAETLVG